MNTNTQQTTRNNRNRRHNNFEIPTEDLFADLQPKLDNQNENKPIFEKLTFQANVSKFRNTMQITETLIQETKKCLKSIADDEIFRKPDTYDFQGFNRFISASKPLFNFDNFEKVSKPITEERQCLKCKKMRHSSYFPRTDASECKHCLFLKKKTKRGLDAYFFK